MSELKPFLYKKGQDKKDTEKKPEAKGQDEAKVRGPFNHRMTWCGHD